MYENYRKIRDVKGLKDSDVAKGSNVTRSTFSDWKSGRSTPKAEKIDRIAEFLGVTSEYFRTGVDYFSGAVTKEQYDNLLKELSKDSALLDAIEKMVNLPESSRKDIINHINELSN